MSVWNISEKLKNKIIYEARKLDTNDARILYLLRNLGPQRFNDLVKLSGLSRSTVSKYLKLNSKLNYVEKKLFKDDVEKKEDQRYFITELGIEKLNEESLNNEETYYFNELNKNVSKLTDLIKYYKEIGVEESIVFQIVKIVSKIGDKFFLMEQSRELYLTLFYMFLNSALSRIYKFEIQEFCKLYNVKKLRIDYYVDKIMSNKLGFYMFTREREEVENDLIVKVNDIFFFQEDDILGTTTSCLIKERLIEEIIYININGYRKIYDLDKISQEIAEKLTKMELIWERIKEPFEMLIEKLIIKNAIEMGFSKTFLMDLVVQSEKILKSREGIKSLIKIIEGSDRYEDLNVVSISEIKEERLETILKQIKGFCPHCGKVILENDLSNTCSKCGQEFHLEDLIKSIDAAGEVSARFKKEILQEEQLTECPNPKCNYLVKLNWDICPECSTPIKKKS